MSPALGALLGLVAVAQATPAPSTCLSAGERSVLVDEDRRAPRERATRLPLERDGRDRVGWAGGDPAAPPARADSALGFLRSGDRATASRIASSLLEGAPEERRIGRRILATVLFLDGDTEAALEHWNRLGEPRIAAVRVGASRETATTALRRRTGLRDCQVLTPSALRLAQRRVADSPAVERARISYRPLPDGRVEVAADVLERRRTPSPPELVGQALRAVVGEEFALGAGPFLGRMERVRLTAGWSGAQRRLAASLSVPSTLGAGVGTLSAEWRAERHRLGRESGPPEEAEHGVARLAFGAWILADVRVEGRLGVERWRPGAVMATAGATGSLRFPRDVAGVEVHVDGWRGGGRVHGRVGLETLWEAQAGSNGAWRVSSGLTLTSPDAPPLLWPGAGTGRLRESLLRGHPLAADGAIVGPAFAPVLAHTTVERRVFRSLGPLRAGASVFVDAAATRATTAMPGGAWLDPGVSVFIGAGADELAVAVARGERGWVASARVGRWR